VCPDEEGISYERAKSAQGRDKSELTDLFPQIQIEFDLPKMKPLMLGEELVLERQSGRAKAKKNHENNGRPTQSHGLAGATNHSSLP
jgi:hypothetical protein